jgi:hypothetical protein
MREPPTKWYDPNADNPPWIKALAEVRHLAPREGWRTTTSRQSSCLLINTQRRCSATESFFLNKPYRIGGSTTKDNIL